MRSEDKGYVSGRSQTKVDLLGRSNAQTNPAPVLRLLASRLASPIPKVALLTGGGDKPYALGLVEALSSAGLSVDFIGSNDLDAPALHDNPHVNFLNLRGDQQSDAGVITKAFQGAEVLPETDRVRCHRQTSNLPHPLEQQIRTL